MTEEWRTTKSRTNLIVFDWGHEHKMGNALAMIAMHGTSGVSGTTRAKFPALTKKRPISYGAVEHYTGYVSMYEGSILQ